MLKEFKAFLLRGNVVDLAVAVVIGIAFGAVIAALVADIITPLIAAIFGSHDFSALTFTINNSTFLYGAFINAVVAFVLVAAAIFFVVVKPMNALNARRAPADGDDQAVPRVPERDPARGSPLRLLHGRGRSRVADCGAASRSRRSAPR